ncbi:MAG: DnaB-like helicase N-terminal domain-containing protein [Acutalibacteraceae bacterium]
MADENRTINEPPAGAGMLGYNNALPFSPEAEQSVLGAILLDSSCLTVLLKYCQDRVFSSITIALFMVLCLKCLHWDSRWTSLRFWKSSKNQNRLMKPGKAYLVQLAQLVPSI